MTQTGRGQTPRWRRLLSPALVVVAMSTGGWFLGINPAAAEALAPAGSGPTGSSPVGSPLPGGAPAGSTRVANGTGGKVAGMAIPNVSEQQSPDEVSRLKSDGLNTISLFVWWVQQQQSSNTIQPDYKDGITETDANLEVQIAASEQAGMQVVLVPIFYCESCQGGWRGTVSPSDPAEWWASYQSFINHYAVIAQRYGVGTFFVGSEMTSMERYTSQWESLIAAVRQQYSGQIGYEENWDVLGNAKFLSDVDIIGVSAYFPLDSAQSPALSDLLSDWTDSHGQGYAGRNWVADLENLENEFHKPILFGEVGYMSGDYAGNQPFLNYQSTTNWQLQSDLYQALLETFSGYSWWDGVVWWEWYLTSDTTSDNDRSPRGKTAEVMLQRWYAQGLRPPSPQTPLAVSPAADSPDDAEIPRYTSSPAAGGSSPAAAQASGRSATAGPRSTVAPGASGPQAAAGVGTGAAGSRRGEAVVAGVGSPNAAPSAPARAGGLGAVPRRTGPGVWIRVLGVVAALCLLAVVGRLIGAAGELAAARAGPRRT